MKKYYYQRVDDTLLFLIRQMKDSSEIYNEKVKEADKVKKVLVDMGIEESVFDCL